MAAALSRARGLYKVRETRSARKRAALKKGSAREEARQVVATNRRPLRAPTSPAASATSPKAPSLATAPSSTLFQALRHRHGPRRKTGARLLSELSKDQKLYDLRDFKRQALN
jgi:hypothetical protein